MGREWTENQRAAFEARGGTVLVSAAAGSGKTAVLVERVIRRIIEDKVPLDRLLIVTFTKAAAAEMRSRIGDAVDSALAENAGDIFLQRQKMLLPNADICTIDSFCNDLVRQNFQDLGISHDFKILDGGEGKVLREETVRELIADKYQNDSAEYKGLYSVLGNGKNDDDIGQIIIDLYNYTRAYPFPDEWLDGCVSQFKNAKTVEETFWGKEILDYCVNAIKYAAQILHSAFSLADDEVVVERYVDQLRPNMTELENMASSIENGEVKWDDICDFVSTFSFNKVKSMPRNYESYDKDLVRDARDSAKKIIDGLSKYLCSTSEQFLTDVKKLVPIVGELVACVKEFGVRLDEKKQKRNSYDFSDIEHFALKLLVGENAEKTPLAQSVSQGYTEIYIDEFQDTNEAQNMIFTAVSKDRSNLFMVGDVKQSIYGFRQAMPEIFVGFLNEYAVYSEKKKNYPAQISLDRNFRSRSGVTSAVNFIFSRIMSSRYGGIDYDGPQMLVAGASYPPKKKGDSDVDVLIIDTDNSSQDKETVQARYIADYIKKTMSDGVTVSENGKERKAKFKDFSIIMRSTKSAAKYVEALECEGIPSYVDTKGELFETKEITYIMSMLRVIDNPLQDIPLLSVLLSPFYSFTPDDVAKIRTSRKISLYSCVLKASGSDEKFKNFVDDIERYRRLSATLTADALIRRIYSQSGYYSTVQAMGNSAQRRANLNLLLLQAVNFEKGEYKGLSAFIRYIDKLVGKSGISEASALPENADVVRIMTIHASKGLEFPFCILANCSKKFNNNNSEQVRVNSQYGVGMKLVNEYGVRYETVPSAAIKLADNKAGTSEELRILYVAMTRAKEKLVLLWADKGIKSKAQKASLALTPEHNVSEHYISKAQSYAELILPCLLCHPSGSMLREFYPERAFAPDPDADFAMNIKILTDEDYSLSDEKESTQSFIDPDVIKELETRSAFEYRYKPLSEISVKRAASEAERDTVDTPFFASARPAFLNQKGLTPAQRGTANHKFMQYANFDFESVERERDRLVASGMLTSREGLAVETDKIERFFESELAKQMKNADELYREYKFATLVKVGSFRDDLPKELQNEEVLIQGIADCVYVKNGKIVIVDYKTDRVKDENELIGRYSAQVETYAKALTKCFDMPVEKTVLYSFALGKEIEIKDV